MSIDVDIFPTATEYAQWSELRRRFHIRTGEELSSLLGALQLRHLGSHKIVDDEDRLSPGGYYYPKLAVENTLHLSVAPNSGNLDEQTYLEDYGRNLTLEAINDCANKWQTAGYYFEITSMMGRSKYESRLMVALACAVADVCDGFIIVMSDDFDFGVGIYTPDQFHIAKPNF